MTKYLLIVLILFLSSLASSEAVSVTKNTGEKSNKTVKYDEFTGIKFGISYSELEKYLNGFDNVSYNDEKEAEGMKIYRYNSNHKLSDASGSMFSFYEDKLAVMGILYLGEESSETFDGLKKLIDDKYGNMNDGIVFSGKKASLIKGRLFFNLEYSHNPFEGDKTLLMVGDIQLTKRAQEKKVKDKAASLGEL